MASKARVLAMVCVVAILAVFAAPAVRADMEKPTWTAGDFWEYSFSGLPFPGGGGGPTPTGTLRINVTGTDSVTVGGTTYTTYRTTMVFSLTLSQGGITISLTITGESWYRTSDLGVVKEVITIPGFFGGGQTSITALYSPPAVMQWPLRSGATWTATSVVDTTTVSQFGTFTDQATQVMSVNVQAETSTTVAAGTFTTSPVRTDLTIDTLDAGYSLDFWSASVGNAVRVQQFDDANQQQMSGDLKSYNYQAGGLFGGSLWLILLLLIIIVAIIAAAVLVRRRKAPATAMPPPGWQQPGMPPPQQWQPPQQPQQPWQTPQQPPQPPQNP